MKTSIKEQSLFFRKAVRELLPTVHAQNIKRGSYEITDLSNSDQVLSLVDLWMESIEYDLDIDQMDEIIQEEVKAFIKQKQNFYKQ